MADQCEKILYALVLTLIFEGILRKLIPPLSTPIFFIKDILCLLCLFIITRQPLSAVSEKLKSKWLNLFLLILPLLLFTATKDPILAIFAAKQYLLYIVIGIVVIVSFPAHKEQQFRSFIFFLALLLVPTTLVAILQNGLPATHWLNMSVGGNSLQGFSAGGYLRVGSTFSFTAQYSWFLNAESFLLPLSFFLPPFFKIKIFRQFQTVIFLGLTLMLVIGTFITGGRTAVLGSAGTLALGFVFIGLKRPAWFISKGVSIIIIGLISLSVLRAVKPEYFKAYEVRSSGTEEVSHNEQLEGRILGAFTGWTDWFWDQDATAVVVGNGLGIMSNGANQVSTYASTIRSTGFWTEGDMPTTFWEGGLYLVIVWYSFRLSLILLCFKYYRSIQNKLLASAVSAPLGYVIIHGLIAQLGMQPPLTIWWWLAIGIIILIFSYDRYKIILRQNKKIQKYEEEHYIR